MGGSVRSTDILALLIVAGWWTGLARAIAGGTPAYAAVLDAILILVLARVVWERARNGFALGDRLLAGLIFAYAALAAVQVTNENVPGVLVGLEGFRKTAFTMAAFFVVAWRSDGSVTRFYSIVAVGSVIPMLYGIRQFFAPFPIELDIVRTADSSFITFHLGPVLRAFAPTAGPFHFGLLSAGVSLISLHLSQTSRWWLVPALVGGLALALSLTRANLIATGIALSVFAIVSASRRARVVQIVMASAVVAAIAVGVAIGAGLIGEPPASSLRPPVSPTETESPGSPSGLDTVAPTAVAPTPPAPTPAAPTPAAPTPSPVSEIITGLADPLADRNLQFRLEFWASHIRAIGERPVTGYGTSSAGDGFGHFYAGTALKHFAPHSLYLKPALELGVGGFILLLAILVRALWLSIILTRQGSQAGRIALSLLLLVGVSGLTGPMLDAYPVNLLFWGALGWVGHPEPLRGEPVSNRRGAVTD